jgi:hypothetical protein
VLERWREASGSSEKASNLYAQHSASLWQRLWTATGDDVEVAHAEGVAVLLLRCLTMIHDFFTPSQSAHLLLCCCGHHECIGMTLAYRTLGILHALGYEPLDSVQAESASERQYCRRPGHALPLHIGFFWWGGGHP